mgnify:CR=1 FL=1
MARGKIANAVLKEALSFFDTGGEIAIFDSSNASKDRRAMLSESVHAHGEATGRPIAIVFAESASRSSVSDTQQGGRDATGNQRDTEKSVESPCQRVARQ